MNFICCKNKERQYFTKACRCERHQCRCKRTVKNLIITQNLCNFAMYSIVTVMTDKKVLIAIDIACCVILLPAMIMFMPVEYWFPDKPLFVVLIIIWLYGIYFINRRICTPMLFRKKQIFQALLWVCFTIIVTYCFILYSRDISPLEDPFANKAIGRIRRLSVWFIFFMITCFSFMIGFLIELHKRTLAHQAVEHEKNKAELALYKAQINPHFLFNTLNTIYGLMISQSEKAESAFLKFTELLRYIYSNSTQDKTSIGEEINYISKYIDLQLLRLNEHTKVYFTHNEDDASIEIAPMILITFIENAFKYGTSSYSDGVISIDIQMKNGILSLATYNQIQKKLLPPKEGIGISNCRKRLDLLYSGAYTLNIVKTEKIHKVALTINLI